MPVRDVRRGEDGSPPGVSRTGQRLPACTTHVAPVASPLDSDRDYQRMTLTDLIRERLSEVRPPGARGDVVQLGMVEEIAVDAGRVRIRFQPKGLPVQLLNGVVADMRRGVAALEGVTQVDIDVVPAPPEARPSPYGDLGPLRGVRHIVAVSSAKGGVGKSTVAVNLACALVRLGQKVGLMDADVYGPSLPTMIGICGRPRVVEQSRVIPLEKYGLQLMSMGFFLDDNTPVIWRGPLVTGLIRQFLKDVEWGELDVLVIDLPPGTGDAQLTLAQQVPLSGGVIVTTPQAVSLIDVERGVAMFRQVNAPVLGVIENMSAYRCPKCGKEEDLFGSGAGKRIAEQFGVPLLAQLPVYPEVRAGGDAGKPIVVDQPSHPASRVFLDVAARLLDGLQAGGVAPPVIVG